MAEELVFLSHLALAWKKMAYCVIPTVMMILMESVQSAGNTALKDSKIRGLIA